jgi:uncharacterized membrane protein YdjX (TVP38/TMEM64 family)
MAAGKSSLWRALAVLSAAMLVPIVPFVVIGELPGERWLEASGANSLSFGALGAGLLALDVLLPIPSSIVGAMLGGRLGFVAGFSWAFLGLCAGQITGYALGRQLPARWSSELAEAPSVALVFLSRPVPVLAEAVAIAAGVERIPFLQFMAAGAAGNACYAAAMAGDGAALLPQGVPGPGLIVPMLVPVVAYVAWRTRGRC